MSKVASVPFLIHFGAAMAPCVRFGRPWPGFPDSNSSTQNARWRKTNERARSAVRVQLLWEAVMLTTKAIWASVLTSFLTLAICVAAWITFCKGMVDTKCSVYSRRMAGRAVSMRPFIIG